jgi:hypothetical protein
MAMKRRLDIPPGRSDQAPTLHSSSALLLAHNSQTAQLLCKTRGNNCPRSRSVIVRTGVGIRPGGCCKRRAPCAPQLPARNVPGPSRGDPDQVTEAFLFISALVLDRWVSGSTAELLAETPSLPASLLLKVQLTFELRITWSSMSPSARMRRGASRSASATLRRISRCSIRSRRVRHLTNPPALDVL